ncbi:MAG: ABC transporter permease [Lachnospiraceae bacterium]|nr:ABC transporter permease [Lachnospiraceae bacterium]
MTHVIKYSFKRFIHNKQQIFWILMFPMILGLFFKVAFSGISSSEAFSSIPTAIIFESEEYKDSFIQVCDNVKNNDRQLLKPTYDLPEDEALKQLETDDLAGIIYVGESLKLKVSASAGIDNTDQSILESFVSQYNASASIIKDIARTHPEKLNDVISISAKESSFNTEHKFVSSNADSMTQYFYNLLAMACLFTALTGFDVAIQNQGNLSDLGIRRNASSTNKMVIIVGELFSAITLNFILNLVAFIYIIVVLKIDMTFHLAHAILALFISTLTGITYGFFLGSIPSKKLGAKEAATIASIMFCCFLSGLMVGSMRIIIQEFCPIINKINPASLISDSFYSLANYENLSRYYLDIISLIVLSVLFTLGGFLFTRRKKYASL